MKKSFLDRLVTGLLITASLFLMGAAYAAPAIPTGNLESVVRSTSQSMSYVSVGVTSFFVIAGTTLIGVGLFHFSKHFAQAQSGQSSIAKPITEIIVGAALLFSVYLVYIIGSGLTGATGSQSDIGYIQSSGVTGTVQTPI